MTNQEFYSLVMSRLGRSTDLLLRAAAVSELSSVLEDLDNSPFHPWFTETIAPLTTTVDSDEVPLPVNFLDFIEDSHVIIQNSEGVWQKLYRVYYENLVAKHINSDASLPREYGIRGTTMYVGPKADAPYEIIISYYCKAAESVPDDATQATNVWLKNARNIVVYKTAANLARYHLFNIEKANEFDTFAEKLRSELFKLNESRKHTDMDYSIDS